MSMINDALRRASNATAPEPLAEPGAVPPPLPAAAFNTLSDLPPLVEPAPAKKSFLPLLLIVLFLFCAAGAAGVYLWERSHKASSQKQEAKGQVVAKTTPEAKAQEPVKTQPVAPKPVESPQAARPATPVTTAAAPAPAPVAPAGNVTFPQLRLQSIYYRPASPSVMINGRTLYVNDQVQGVTVAAIDPSSVTLVLSGRTNVLTLR